MNKYKKEINKNLKLFIMTTIAVAVIFGMFIFFNHKFLLNVDQQLQYNIFYEEWIRLFKGFIAGEGFPMYSWDSFLGSDFYSSQAYYVIGDIFLPMFLLFDKISPTAGVRIALFFETIFCVYISAFSMRLFLKEYGIKKEHVLDGISLIYAISGWALLFYGQYMFHRFYAFLPLLFYGLERIINHKRNWVFIITVFILFLQSYYLMFPTTIFLLIYGIFTTKNRGIENKEVFKIGLYAVICYLIGFLLSAFLSVPAFTYTFLNPRVGQEHTGLLWKIQTYLGFYFNLISSPFPVYTNYYNIFYAGTNGHQYWYSLFVGIIPLVVCLKMMFEKKYKAYRNVILILIMFILFKPLSSIMHGFSEPSLRWTFLLILFMLLMSAKGLNDSEDNKQYDKVFFAYAIGFVVLFIFGISKGLISAKFHEHAISLIVALLSAIIIYFVFRKNTKAGILLLIIQMCAVDVHLMHVYNKDFYYYEDPFTASEFDQHYSDDEDLIYRYYIDNTQLAPQSPMNLNKSIQFHYMGLSTYNTLYDANVVKFIDLNDINWHLIDINNPDVMQLLGVKYFLVKSEEELPTNLRFEYAYDIGEYHAYENMCYKGFGYTTNNVDHLPSLWSLQQFSEAVFVDDLDYDISKYQHDKQGTKFNVTEKGNNYLKGYIECDSTNILQIPIPNNKGWNITRNGEKVDTISVNGGFIGIEVEEGMNEIEMNFTSPNLELGIILSFIGFLAMFLVGNKKLDLDINIRIKFLKHNK